MRISKVFSWAWLALCLWMSPSALLSVSSVTMRVEDLGAVSYNAHLAAVVLLILGAIPLIFARYAPGVPRMLFFGMFALASLAWAGLLAWRLGGFVHPVFGVLGWGIAAVLPAAVVAAPVWLICTIVSRGRR